MGILLTQQATGTAMQDGSGLFLVGYLIFFIFIMWFFFSRPQKKEQKRLNAMYASMAVGDSVLTNSGFMVLSLILMMKKTWLSLSSVTTKTVVSR